ncbi:MAG: VOC family protein [Nocardioidaceae bacterium]
MRFGFTILYVRDAAASVAFYERAFGLARRFEHASGQYAELETGATALAFASRALAADNLPPGLRPDDAGDGRPAFEICLVTDDVEGAFERAVQAGAEPVTAPRTRAWGQDVAFVLDPDGVLVELASPT